ncbi:MAG: YihY/virulence factor BrkB family protein [Flavobacteriales bacterium]|nr:YihY/virulence factor BrkB family protein [Flavobacteriales bacterium]MCB9166093.1 YihY/virulence factor BrkB family protein [Flavobacteriales bacterium]
MAQRLFRRLLYSRTFRELIRWGDRVVLPGFAGFSIYAISRFYFKALSEGRLATRASAISFKLFTAFFPATIVLLTLIPFIPIPDLQENLLRTFHDMMPAEVYRFIEGTLHDLVVKKHGTLLSVSFITGLYLASNSINAILLGFSGSSNLITWHSPLKQRLLSLALLLALTLLMLIAIPVMAISDTVIGLLQEKHILTSGLQVLGLFAAKWTISIFLLLLSVSLLYYVGDPQARRFKLFTPGALLTLAMILVLSQALAYIFSNITDYNALYGSIGAILAVQFWIYLNMFALLVGYELNISISRARHGRELRLRDRTP